MADIKISELNAVASLNNGDLVEVSQEDSYAETGYSSKSAKMTDIGEKVVNGIEYANELNTSSKRIIGAINEIASYTPVYGNTASGAIATFETSLALPLQNCEIAINAVQESGTPTPSSPKLISGFTGANIYDKGVNLWDEVTEEGYINSSGNPTTNVNSLRSKNFLPCTPNTAYYCYIPEDVIGGLAVCWYDINQTFISRDNQTHNVTSPSNAFYFRLSLYNYKGTYPSYANNVSLNYPATDTAYHAYNANSTTTAITWQTEAGTVYGGSLDVTSGVLTVTYGFVDLGDLSWSYNSTNQYFTNSTAIDNFKGSSNTTERQEGLLCEAYSFSTSTSYNTMTDKSMLRGTSNVVIKNTDYTDADLFKTSLTGVKLIYELATPVTYQLTPTQIQTIVSGGAKTTNNIFTDTNGNTSVVYACSLKDYIDSQ